MEEIVHIIPLGFEDDRVVKPFEKYRANKVYLLYSRAKQSIREKHDPEHFKEAVSSKLIDKGITVEPIEADIFSILDILSKVSSIIVKEKAEHNNIYVNMSAASKPAAVAATIAAMYHDVKVYYVKADSYTSDYDDVSEHGLSIIREPRMTVLANFNIDIPSEAKLAFLVELYNKERAIEAKKSQEKMSTHDILRLIANDEIKGFEDLKAYIHKNKSRYEVSRDYRSTVSMRINKGLLSDLKQKKYIDIEKRGTKNYFTITDKGKYAACLSGKLN